MVLAWTPTAAASSLTAPRPLGSATDLSQRAKAAGSAISDSSGVAIGHNLSAPGTRVSLYRIEAGQLDHRSEASGVRRTRPRVWHTPQDRRQDDRGQDPRGPRAGPLGSARGLARSPAASTLLPCRLARPPAADGRRDGPPRGLVAGRWRRALDRDSGRPGCSRSAARAPDHPGRIRARARASAPGLAPGLWDARGDRDADPRVSPSRAN